MKLLVFLFILNLGKIESEGPNSEENLPTSCHVCKHTVAEFLQELDHTANSKDVLQLGQVLQSERPKTMLYHKSSLRLIEALENTCENIKDYKVHKDRPNHLRYAKDESSTFTTLKNLKKRGVEVNLGFPDEMWDSPDAEIMQLKRQCETILEKYEDYLNDWYYNDQENNLFNWFCKDRVLKGQDFECLKELIGLDETKKNEVGNHDGGDGGGNVVVSGGSDDDDDDDDDDDKMIKNKNKVKKEKKNIKKKDDVQKKKKRKSEKKWKKRKAAENKEVKKNKKKKKDVEKEGKKKNNKEWKKEKKFLQTHKENQKRSKNLEKVRSEL